jgi:gamma-glutamyl hercynylcysteine S-oxide hydrolase
MWGDASLPDLARVTRSAAVLAAVRSATPGMALGEAAVAPFGSGPWLFSHNGALEGWPVSAEQLFVRENGFSLFSLEAMVDSAFLWALVLRRLSSGDAADVALAETIGEIEAAGGSGRFNFLMTDGRSIAATTAGDTLWYRQSPGAVVVASEPGDDEPGWTEVPDRQVLTAAPDRVTVRPLTAITERIAVR